MPDFDTAVAEGSGTDTAAAATPAAADTDVSIDSLIAQAIAANPEPSTAEGMPSEQVEQTEAATEGAAPAETVAVAATEEAPTETEQPQTDVTEALDLKQARKLLAEANRRQAEAREAAKNAEAEFIRQLRINPRAALQKHNLQIDELIDIDLATERPAEQTQAAKESDRVTKLEQELQRIRAESDQAKISAAKANISGQIAKDDKFSMINRSNSVDMVFEFMEAYYNEHGSPVPWNKAAQIVEKNLRDRFGAPPAKAVAAPPKSQQQQKEVVTASKQVTVPGQTLTNNAVRTSVPSDDEPTDPDALIRYLVAKEEAKAAKLAQ